MITGKESAEEKDVFVEIGVTSLGKKSLALFTGFIISAKDGGDKGIKLFEFTHMNRMLFFLLYADFYFWG